MHVLFITSDERFLEEASEQRELLEMMSEATESLHAVVLTAGRKTYARQQINEHTWVYPTNTYFRFFSYYQARLIIRLQVVWQGILHADIVLSDDPRIAGLLGMHVAHAYHRVWMLNLHEYYWEYETSLAQLLARFTTLPLADVFQSAMRIGTYSTRVAAYLAEAAPTDVDRAKVVAFPEFYTAPRPEGGIDLAKKYPDFNFIVLYYHPHRSGALDEALAAVSLLRESYRRAGLVVLSRRPPGALVRAAVRRAGAGAWVRFEQIRPDSFPYQGGQVLLYFGTGEEEDAVLLRAVANSQLAVARETVLTRQLFRGALSSLLVADSAPQSFAAAIRSLNETPGQRELIKVNEKDLLGAFALPSRESMLELLRSFFTYDYIQMPDGVRGPDTKLLSDAVKRPAWHAPIMARLARLKNRYTKLRP